MTNTQREFEILHHIAHPNFNNYEKLPSGKYVNKYVQDDWVYFQSVWQTALTHTPQWISVEDRLPDYGVDVIAMETDGRVYRLSRREHNQYFWDASKYYYTEVIFWMPFTPPIDQAKE